MILKVFSVLKIRFKRESGQVLYYINDLCLEKNERIRIGFTGFNRRITPPILPLNMVSSPFSVKSGLKGDSMVKLRAIIVQNEKIYRPELQQLKGKVFRLEIKRRSGNVFLPPNLSLQILLIFSYSKG